MPETFQRLAIQKFPSFQSMESPEVKVAWFNAYAALVAACKQSGDLPAHPEVQPGSQQEPINQELLKVLKTAEEALRHRDCCFDDAEWQQSCRNIAQNARDLIAKAEGRNA